MSPDVLLTESQERRATLACIEPTISASPSALMGAHQQHPSKDTAGRQNCLQACIFGSYIAILEWCNYPKTSTNKLLSLLLDFTMQCHSVELRAKLHELKSFGSISPIFCGRIAGYTWRAFFGRCSCSALCTFKSDYNSNTFTLSHENEIAIKIKWLD